MTIFNEYLKQTRLAANLTLENVAKESGLHRNTIANYEKDREPTLDYLIVLSRLSGVDIAEIVKVKIDGLGRGINKKLSYTFKYEKMVTVEALSHSQAFDLAVAEIKADLNSTMPAVRLLR